MKIRARAARKAVKLTRLAERHPALERRVMAWIARATMDDPSALRAFWTQPEPEGNVPADYIAPVERSQALARFIDDVPKEARVLEVGCNVGRNLAYLHDQGWTNVEGIEISPHAVALLRTTYPQLSDAEIHLGSAEEVLPKLSGPYGLIFTMAVIEHLHPSSAAVFDEMARLATRLLCVEPEGHVSHRQFPHDVPAIFTGRGFQCIDSWRMKDQPETSGSRDLEHYTAWRLERASDRYA